MVLKEGPNARDPSERLVEAMDTRITALRLPAEAPSARSACSSIEEQHQTAHEQKIDSTW
jgi:hypothetical protein